MSRRHRLPLDLIAPATGLLGRVSAWTVATTRVLTRLKASATLPPPYAPRDLPGPGTLADPARKLPAEEVIPDR